MNPNNTDIYQYNLSTDSLGEDDRELPYHMNRKISECFDICRGNLSADIPEYADVIFYTFTSGENRSSFKVSQEYMIQNFDMPVTSIIIRLPVFVKTGCFNEFLGSGCVLEFLYRASSVYNVFCNEISSSDMEINSESNTNCISNNTAEALAYMMCRHTGDHAGSDNLPVLLNSLVSKLKLLEKYDVFMRSFSRFTSDPSFFKKCVNNTAPIFIISGKDARIDILNEFASGITRAFIKKGQAVLTTGSDDVTHADLDEIDGQPIKGFVGFQASSLFDNYFRSFDSPRFQFWLDDPVFFEDLFENIDNSVYMLCQDSYYAHFLAEYYGIRHAFQFPPASNPSPEPDYTDRNMDIIFIGTYREPIIYDTNDDLANELYRYMHEHIDLTYEKCVNQILKSKGICLSRNEYLTLISQMTPVLRYIRAEYRLKVVEAIVSGGIKLHVYGDEWKDYKGSGADNLIIHQLIPACEILNEMKHAKICLNIMSWHKGGMTERVIHSMLAGAICLSDKSTYLQNDIMRALVPQYDLNNLNKLTDIIQELLHDEKKRISIAKQAYEHAITHETWDSRVEDLLMLMKQ